MNDKLRGFLGFLGLIEDEYGEYGSTGAAPARPFSEPSVTESEAEWTTPAPRQFPTSATTSTPMRPSGSGRSTAISVLDSSGQAPRIRPMANPGSARGVSPFSQERDVAIFEPRSYDESRRITDLLRSNRAVVLKVHSVDANLGRRLVDFASGTAYALNAKIEILGNSVYLISPQGMHLSPEAKDRLRATGYRDPGDV